MAAIFATILQIRLSAHYHLCGLGPAAGTGLLHHLVPRAWLGDLWFLKEEEAGVGRQGLEEPVRPEGSLLPAPWVPTPVPTEGRNWFRLILG